MLATVHNRVRPGTDQITKEFGDHPRSVTEHRPLEFCGWSCPGSGHNDAGASISLAGLGRTIHARHLQHHRLTQDPLVQRIFVNAAIKKALCREAGDDRAWLEKVRPWWGHDYHFHVDNDGAVKSYTGGP